MTECVILFRDPHTGLVDAFLENDAEILVFDNRQQAVACAEHHTAGGLPCQIVELDAVMSTRAMRAALRARDR